MNIYHISTEYGGLNCLIHIVRVLLVREVLVLVVAAMIATVDSPLSFPFPSKHLHLTL